MDDLTAEERLLILLSLNSHTDEQRQDAQRLVGAVDSWPDFAHLAELNAIVPLAHANLERLDLAGRLPEDVRSTFETAATKIRQANEARLGVCRTLFERFADRGLQVVILKGVLFGETVYRNPYYKKMNDIDILVRKEDLDQVFDIYEGMDLFSAAELVGGNARKQEKFSHHAPPFFSRDLACMIGTHWGLITPLAPYRIDYEAIWSRIVEFEFYGRPAWSMAPEDNLHHVCVHLPYYKTGLRELADIYNLVRHHGAVIDWDLLLREVEKAGTENLLHHALSLADRIWHLPEAAAAIAAVEPRVSWYFRRDTRRKIRSQSRLLRSRSVHMSRIEKAFGDLRATDRPREKWSAFFRMWWNMLFPPAQDVARLSSLEDPGMVALLVGRLVAPWRIFRVFARDVGAKMFTLIMIKCAVDVVVQTFRAPFQRTPVQDYESYARKLGVSVDDLNRFKDALE